MKKNVFIFLLDYNKVICFTINTENGFIIVINEYLFHRYCLAQH